MKHLITSTLFFFPLLSVVIAADVPAPVLPDAAKKLLKEGIKNETDLKAFLLAAPAWTWERKGTADTVVKFEADGVATHPVWVGKWVATSSRKVVIRVPSIGTHTLTFADDLMSYKGVWNNHVPFSGKVSP